MLLKIKIIGRRLIKCIVRPLDLGFQSALLDIISTVLLGLSAFISSKLSVL